MIKDIKAGLNVFYVNMTYFYGWNKFFTCTHPLENKGPILEIKVDKVTYDSDGKPWINHNLKGEYAFQTEREAKDFVLSEATKDNLRYEKEIIDLKARILHNDKMILRAKT